MTTKGLYNSSITRVRPVFQHLINMDKTAITWLPELLNLATKNHNYAEMLSLSTGNVKGGLFEKRKYNDRVLKYHGIESIQLENCFEFDSEPPKDFLKWLIKHPHMMKWPEKSKDIEKTFGDNTQKCRKELFENDYVKHDAAILEGLLLLNKDIENGFSKPHNGKWWRFEGFTEVDCCIETDNIVLFIEGKRTEKLSYSTDWYPKRNQLIRNLEAAREYAKEKEYAVILAAEEDIIVSDNDIKNSLPHYDDMQRKKLMRHYLGCVTWGAIVDKFGISNIPDTICDVMRTL